jgi:Fic family protein
MLGFIHQHPDWPKLFWDNEQLAYKLASVRHLQGELTGRMSAIGFDLQDQASFSVLTEDIIKTSEIEGEKLNLEQVRSSLANRLGIQIGALSQVDRNVEGIVEVVLDAVNGWDRELTVERLFSWHAALFPTGWSGLKKISIGSWRTDANGPMQVVSGGMGNEKIHFEAPEAFRIEHEMNQFLEWFNAPLELDPLLKAALAHLWFVTIHPFDDGNGRIARAIADLTLARSEASARRFYSMSSQIRLERSEYYRILEATQRGDLDITSWLNWFLDCLERAIHNSEDLLGAVIQKARFWAQNVELNFNPRQRLMLNKLLDDFQGNLTTSKWAKLAKCSQDTALRDIQELEKSGVLVKNPGGGRSTSYAVAKPTVIN